MGIDKEDMTAYQELQKKIEQTQAELQTCENGLNKLMANPVHDEKVSMMIQRLTRAVYTLKSSRFFRTECPDGTDDKAKRGKDSGVRAGLSGHVTVFE